MSSKKPALLLKGQLKKNYTTGDIGLAASHSARSRASTDGSVHVSTDGSVRSNLSSPKNKRLSTDPSDPPIKEGERRLINFLKDEPKEMTWGRRIALTFINEKWYNPHAGEILDELEVTPVQLTESEVIQNQKPSLRKAWAYFEHVSLSRYILEPKEKETKNICLRILHKFSKAGKEMQRAEPGESNLPTRLYSPIFTPHAQVRP